MSKNGNLLNNFGQYNNILPFLRLGERQKSERQKPKKEHQNSKR
jgi:hypothetical protein